MIITGTITFIRRRQQKLQQHRKEQEYLRYFHSVLPHSQIYGNLNETFSKPDRRKSSKRASIKNKGLSSSENTRRVSVTSVSSTVTNMLKRFQYQQPFKKTVSQDADDDDDESKYIEMLDEGIGIESCVDIDTHRGQSECTAEATVHSAFNKKFNFTVTDMEDVQINETTTAENVCQKFFFPMDNRSGAINSTMENKKHEPSSPRVRFSIEKDEIMQDRIDSDTNTKNIGVTVADPESDKSDIAEGGKCEKNSAENGKVLTNKSNGLIKLMQRISENSAHKQNTYMQKQTDVSETRVTNETESSNERVLTTSAETISEKKEQNRENSIEEKSEALKKSSSFVQTQRCERNKAMFSKKYEFLFDDNSDVQVSVL